MKIKLKGFEIVPSKHALERFNERQVEFDKAIKSLKKVDFEKYSNGLNLMIIDEKQGITIICDVRLEVVVIVTVLNKTDVFVKNNTAIERTK